MTSVLAKILNSSPNLNASNVFDKAKERLGTSASNGEIENFQNFLNGVYRTSMTRETLPNEEIEKEIDKALKIATERVDLDTTTLPEIDRKIYGITDREKYITAKTIENRLKQIDKFISSGLFTEGLESWINFMASNREKLEILVKQEKKYILTSDLIKEFDELYNIIIKNITFPLRSQDEMGKAFEKFISLAAVSSLDSIVDKEVSELVDKINVGSKPVDRGQLQETISIGEDETISVQEYFKDEWTEIKVAFDKKQGKTDVNITLIPNSEYPFKISAKNWANSSGRDFGDTFLQYAILRTENLEGLLQYGIGLGITGKDDESNLKRYHDYAKACAFVDTIMGYSQEVGYADTIVVLDRSKIENPIKVYSISSLIKNMETDQDKLRAVVSGYNDESVYSALADSLGGDALEDQPYLSKILAALADVKVRVMSSALNNKANKKI